MRRMMMFVFAVVVSFGVAGMGSLSASAHEHRSVSNDKYSFVVGYLNEPAVSGELNSVDLRIADMSQATPSADGGEPTGAPVEGLETTLNVDVIFGDQTKTLTLEARWGTPGAYNGWLIPVVAGDYSFHVYGTINGDTIDEMFTPGPETFSSVEDRTELEFPVAEASPAASTAMLIGTTGDISGGSGGPGGTMLAGLAAIVLMAGAGLFFARRKPVLQTPAFAGSAGD